MSTHDGLVLLFIYFGTIGAGALIEWAEKKLKKKSDAFSGAYWCIATAIYLGWSFWTMRWDFTWIIWPVAGVLFAAVSGIFRAVMQNEKKKIE